MFAVAMVSLEDLALLIQLYPGNNIWHGKITKYFLLSGLTLILVPVPMSCTCPPLLSFSFSIIQLITINKYDHYFKKKFFKLIHTIFIKCPMLYEVLKVH